MEKPKRQLLPGIVLLNRNYFPESRWDGFKVGATSFAISIIDCLQRNNLLTGLILYKRNQRIEMPLLEQESMNGVPTVTLQFNFSMAKELLQKSIASAVSLLQGDSPGMPIVYYQTDTLLAYHPEQFPCCVTHHGPFVEDFASIYSEEEAHQAYGSEEKVNHLTREQRKGIDALRSIANAHVLQHSELQRDYLIKAGINEGMIDVMSPPILYGDAPDAELDHELKDFLTSC